MTIGDCILLVDQIKPNQFAVEDKLRWLSFCDAMITEEVLKTHEGYTPAPFIPYGKDDMEKYLIAQAPYDQLYIEFIKMKIDEENGETQRYNNSAVIFNGYYIDYKKWYNRTHRPKALNIYV